MLSVLLVISSLFIAALVIRSWGVRRLCAICFAIAITWLILLLLSKQGRWIDPVLLALLMGQSIAGAYYFLRGRLARSLRIFTLPFFLTLTVLAYMLISSELSLPSLGFTLSLWSAAYLIFIYRLDPGKPLARKLMDCCGEEEK